MSGGVFDFEFFSSCISRRFIALQSRSNARILLSYSIDSVSTPCYAVVMVSEVALLASWESTPHPVFTPKLFRIRRSEKCLRKSFVIRTCKSLDLKFFRIRTCEKNLFSLLLRLTKHPKRMFILSERSESKDLEQREGRGFSFLTLTPPIPFLTARSQAILSSLKSFDEDHLSAARLA